MQDHATDPGVYIRSMSSRGHLGGLAAATPQAVRVLEGAGCDVVLVETVGVGPGRGRGRLAGRHHAGAARARHGRRDPGGEGRHPRDRRRLRGQQGRPGRRRRHLPRHPGHDRRSASAAPGEWRPQVVRAVAARGEGIDDVVAAIDKHRAWLVEHGELRRRRERRAAAEVEAIALGVLRARMGSVRAGTGLRDARRDAWPPASWTRTPRRTAARVDGSRRRLIRRASLGRALARPREARWARRSWSRRRRSRTGRASRSCATCP